MAVHDQAPVQTEATPSTEPSAPAFAPAGPTAATVLSLQRRAGNAAVTQLLARREAPVDDVWVPAGMRSDRGTAVDHWQMRHLRHQGPLAVRGAGEDATGLDADDVRQGAVGDCFFLSPLMAITRINPSRIRNMIRGPIGQTSAGANVYEVTFHTGDGRRTYRVDDRFVTGPDGRPMYAQYGDISAVGPEIWVMVMEKAWAAMRGNSYDATNFGQISDAYTALMDSASDWHWNYDHTDDQLITMVQTAIMEGRPVCASSKPDQTPDAMRARRQELGIVMVPSHAYNIKGCHSGARTFDTVNPHGVNHLPNLNVRDFRLFFDGLSIARDSAR